MKITNTTSTLQVIRTKGGEDVDLQPGETKSVDVNKDEVRFAAQLAAGVFVEAESREKAKVETAAKPAT